MITPHNVLRHELIGLKIKIVDATHPGYKITGDVVDETRETLSIRQGKDIKVVPKDCVTIELSLPDSSVVRINGKLLLSRPEDRIKKKHRIKFV